MLEAAIKELVKQKNKQLKTFHQNTSALERDINATKKLQMKKQDSHMEPHSSGQSDQAKRKYQLGPVFFFSLVNSP